METYSEYQRDNKRAVIVERNKKYEIDLDQSNRKQSEQMRH